MGRGIGSGTGKTAGRGHKGLKGSLWRFSQAGFRGWSDALAEALPKYGFTSRIGRTTASGAFARAEPVDGELSIWPLKAADLVKDDVLRARVFLSGTIDKAVNVKGLCGHKGCS